MWSMNHTLCILQELKCSISRHILYNLWIGKISKKCVLAFLLVFIEISMDLRFKASENWNVAGVCVLVRWLPSKQPWKLAHSLCQPNSCSSRSSSGGSSISQKQQQQLATKASQVTTKENRSGCGSWLYDVARPGVLTWPRAATWSG